MRNLPPDVLGLYMLNQQHPVLYRFTTKPLLLGRDLGSETGAAIDLAAYKAGLLGVSRKHAIIKRKDNAYFIEDVDSTNGTHINDVRLQPHEPQRLKTGDQLRLGHFVIYIGFTEVVTSDSTLYLRPRGGKLEMITPTDIATHIAPYITSIGTLQTIINEYLDKDASQVMVKSITLEQNEAVCIKMTGVNDAVRFVERHVAAWRARYSPASEAIEHAAATATGRSGSGSLAPPRTNTKDILAQLTKTLLKDLTPTRNTGELKLDQYNDRLSPHLRFLVTGSLGIVSGPGENPN